MPAPPQKCASLRRVLLFLVCCAVSFSPAIAFAVRPFVTDDARIVYKGQLETESYAGLTLTHRDKPTVEARALQGMSLTDRLEIIAGGFGFTYQADQARPLDMLIQPKYVIYRSFGAIPSLSVAAASLFPLSGNRQQWNSYAMAHASWFLFTPEDSTDPYDNGLAVHINLGTKSQYDAGPANYRSKLYWAAAFEVITPFSREIRFLGEVFTAIRSAMKRSFPRFKQDCDGIKLPIPKWTSYFEASAMGRNRHASRQGLKSDQDGIIRSK